MTCAIGMGTCMKPRSWHNIIMALLAHKLKLPLMKFCLIVEFMCIYAESKTAGYQGIDFLLSVEKCHKNELAVNIPDWVKTTKSVIVF